MKLIVGLLIFNSFAGDMWRNQTSQTERVGFSSSYLPMRSGPLTQFKQVIPKNQYLDLDDGRSSVAERFDSARKGVLDSGFSFENFYRAIGWRIGAKDWEGFCHQWSAAQSDKRVKELLHNSNKILCKGNNGGVVLDFLDLRELFTAAYPGQSIMIGGKQAFYGLRTSKNKFQSDSVNMADEEMKKSVGWDNFKAHVFHENVHKYLKENQGAVMDQEPQEGEVWNQPIHKVESTVVDAQFEEIKAIPINYLQANPGAKPALLQIDAINKTFLALIKNTKKTNTFTTVSSTLKEYAQKGPLYESVKRFEKSNKILEVVKFLHQKKNELYDIARREGIQLNPAYELKNIQSKVHYLDETDLFREGGKSSEDQEFKVGNFHYLVLLERGTQNVAYSRWLGNNVKGERPDFLWIPKCETDTCHIDAAKYKDMAFLGLRSLKNRKLGQTIGLSDLLKLLEQCPDYDTALEQARNIVNLVNSKNYFWQMSIEERNSLLRSYNFIQNSGIQINKESFKKLTEKFKIPRLNNNSIVDWDEQGNCIQTFKDAQGNVQSQSVQKSSCQSENGTIFKMKGGKCKEKDNTGFFRKYIRSVPSALCR